MVPVGRLTSAIALSAFAIALFGSVSSAAAAERIVAIPQSTYATSNVAIDQGEPLTFLNLDALSHDVTARGKGPNGKPLFSTPLISTGQEVPVQGADALTPGNYAFYCTIHPNMEGTLSVGGGGGGGEGASGLEVRIVDSKLSEVRRDGALTVELTHDRSAEVTLSATTKAGGEAVRLGRRKQEFEGSGSHPVEIPLSKSGRKALRGEDKAKVAVSARAERSGGERDTAKARATLR